MDRAKLSDEIIEDLGRGFVSVLKRNAAELVEGDLDSIERVVQAMGRNILGPVVQQVVRSIAAAGPDERPVCAGCKKPMRPVDYQRPRELVGLVGDFGLTRAYYYCDACDEGFAPLDELLGIGPGCLSPRLQRVACFFGIDDSFQDAATALGETMQIELHREVPRRVTEGVGEVAEAEEQAAMALAQAGKEPLAKEMVSATSSTLLVEVDGAMVHEVDGQWHEVKSGLAAPLGPGVETDQKTGRSSLVMGEASYCAGFETAEVFWYRVFVEACRRGLGTAMVMMVVLLGDGADWIWRYGRTFLAVAGVKLVEIVDIYHAFQHLAVVAKAVFGEGSPQGGEWLEPLKRDLEAEGPGPILGALATLNAESECAREEVRKAIGYFTEHTARMDYPRFRALNLPIGSGAIESTCKTLIERREKGAGMRWTESGAQSVASLRAVYRSGRWDAFWKTHPQRRRRPVAASPKSTAAASPPAIRQAA
jgi:hypothetical protein